MTVRFVESLAKLEKNIKSSALNKLYLLARDPRHPSLHVEKLFNGIYTARIDLNYRIVHQFTDEKIRLMYIGSHDDVYDYANRLRQDKNFFVREPAIRYKVKRKMQYKRNLMFKRCVKKMVIGIRGYSFTPTALIRFIGKMQIQRRKRRVYE